MIAVADTSPINYLTLLTEIELLTKMHGTVVIQGSSVKSLSDRLDLKSFGPGSANGPRQCGVTMATPRRLDLMDAQTLS
jgi:predicted nucleic acid-binding protein